MPSLLLLKKKVLKLKWEKTLYIYPSTNDQEKKSTKKDLVLKHQLDIYDYVTIERQSINISFHNYKIG